MVVALGLGAVRSRYCVVIFAMKWLRIFIVLFFAWMPFFASAQWTTQTVELNPGWNAVHFEVAPQPSSLDVVFAGKPVESVWKWNRRFSHIEFVSDPYELVSDDPHWQVWLPSGGEQRFLSTLVELQGAQSYLIYVATNAEAFSMTVKGQVKLPFTDWFPHGLSLVGMPVHPDNPPTFADYFAFTSEVHTDRGFENQLMKIEPDGHGVTIVQPMREQIRSGTAYWVGCDTSLRWMGPVHAVPSGAGKLDFGSEGVRQELSLRNTLPDRALTLNVQLRESLPAAAGFSELAGPVPLSCLMRNASNQLEWVDFPAEGLTQTVAPGASWELIFGVRRQDFADYAPVGDDGWSYQSYLEVTDDALSLRLRVPIVAQKESTASQLQAIAAPEGDEVHHEKEGLWVGSANLTRVNAPAYSGTNVLETTAPMNIRIIMHVNGFGQASLLQDVILAWDDSLTDPPHTNGTYALFSDDVDVPSDADGETYRISSVAFPLMDPLIMIGSVTNVLSGQVAVAFDDPTNPSLHRYHPMHDNKDWDFNVHSNAVETLDILREVAFTFDPVPTNMVHDPYWGGDRAEGTYRETMKGLREQDILVEGPFFLERITKINELK